jgi:hypothetical protein
MVLCLCMSGCSLLKRLRANQSEKDRQVFLLGLLASGYLKQFSQLGHYVNFLYVIRSGSRRKTNTVS